MSAAAMMIGFTGREAAKTLGLARCIWNVLPPLRVTLPFICHPIRLASRYMSSHQARSRYISSRPARVPHHSLDLLIKAEASFGVAEALLAVHRRCLPPGRRPVHSAA